MTVSGGRTRRFGIFIDDLIVPAKGGRPRFPPALPGRRLKSVAITCCAGGVTGKLARL
jgi:hypothetical protein